MFFTDVYGPHSTDEFNAVFVERLQPQLAAEQVIAAGWFDASGYVIAGYASFDPSDLVVRLLGSGGWDGKTRFFTGLPGHRAGLPTTMPTFATCDLPFN